MYLFIFCFCVLSFLGAELHGAGAVQGWWAALGAGGFRRLFFFVSVYLLLLCLFLHLGAGLYGVGVVRWRLDAGEVFAAILFVSIYFCFCIPSSLWVGRWSCAGMAVQACLREDFGDCSFLCLFITCPCVSSSLWGRCWSCAAATRWARFCRAGGKGGDIPFAGSGRGRSPAEKRAQNGSNVGYG